MKKHLILIICVLILPLLAGGLSSCRDFFTGEETTLGAGDILSPEEIESIFAAVSAAVTEKYPAETDESGNAIVFWLNGGSVWHTSSKCASIANAEAEAVNSGAVEDAVEAGKKRACKVCSDGSSAPIAEAQTTDEQTSDVQETIEKYPKTTETNGELVVYWVKGGEVWHESRHCPSISGKDDDEVFSGSEDDALSAGKKRVCKRCS